YAQRLSDGLRRTVERSDLLRRGNSHLHNRLFDWIAFLSPAFHPVEHLLHPETESRQFRSCLGGGVAEDPVAISYYDLVSGQGTGCGRVDSSVGHVDASWNMPSGVRLGGSGIDHQYSRDLVRDVVVDI